MVKFNKIELDDYVEIISAAIEKFGFISCPVCGRVTAPIKRHGEEEFYFNDNISSCLEHSGFDLITGNTEEGKKIILYDRLN